MTMVMDVVKQDIERAYKDVFTDSYRLETIELTAHELDRFGLGLPVIRHDLDAEEYGTWGDEDDERWGHVTDYCTLTLHYVEDIGTLVAIYEPHN